MPTEAIQAYKPDSVSRPFDRGSYHLSGIAVTNDLYRPTRDSIAPPERLNRRVKLQERAAPILPHIWSFSP